VCVCVCVCVVRERGRVVPLDRGKIIFPPAYEHIKFKIIL
jgi:hypothetical protein